MKAEEFSHAGRWAIPLSTANLTRARCLSEEESLPLLVEPAVRDLDPVEWAGESSEWLNQKLLEHGGILLRGFELSSREAFAKFVCKLTPALMDYSDQHTPRKKLGDYIYTSTDYPADQTIELHSEMSYSHSWPKKIWFSCITPPETGGETPLADNRKVLTVLDPEIVKRFEQYGVMYVRNYGDGLGLSWQTAFGISNRQELERHFQLNSIKWEWKSGDRLRTCYVGAAVVTHPITGERVWFNQAHAFHASSLPPQTRAALLTTFRENELPNHSYYGDGSPIEDSVLDHVRRAYAQVAVSFPWEKGDTLMLDNLLVAHGRSPFKGPRAILVAMGEASS